MPKVAIDEINDLEDEESFDLERNIRRDNIERKKMNLRKQYKKMKRLKTIYN